MGSPVLYGLPPIVGPGAHTLMLGNMPSALSLTARQSYGNPRNAFWRITGAILGFAADAPYAQRCAALTAHRIAVWDVLRSCRREGSLDSAVQRDSMVANDFEGFFAEHRCIARVLFNGAAAEQNFGRLVPVTGELRYRRLPSTSPAQTMRFEDKLAIWRDAITAWQ
ncbi:DNA-deoxyinosine glycosylase [Mycobacterium sp. E740]|uniref:DNA-deoxyinosine glycosylase n=1 Tax=Mycobacterium sp. E740 TaxID=1834149 RepID=UPI0007FDE496|nr:DNA-deoxyinosine glycosylase [Mycobacterium sp. E740]OBI83834.1 DNA-deoxyinosine glycosylase [Mycobacterium sp. E740]